MSWQQTPIALLADVRSGGGAPQDDGAYSEAGLPFVRAGSLIKLLTGTREDELEKIEPTVAAKHGLKLFPPGTVLFAKSGMSATKGHVYALRCDAYVVNHLAALVPIESADSAFLVHALQRFSPTVLIKDSAYPSIRLRDIEEMLLLAPPQATERTRIAAILDQADAIRRKRQKVLEALSRLRRSVFNDLFGDPGTNPMKWAVKPISELADSTQYGTNSKAGNEGQFPILRMGNLTYEGDWKLDDLKYLDLAERDIEKYTVKRGDILFNRTNSPDLVGKTAVFREDQQFAFAGYLVRLRLNQFGHPEYISAYLNSAHGKAILRGMCKSIIGMANINAKELTSIRLPVPPVELQVKFANVVEETRVAEKIQRSHLSRLETLFAALQQRAFRGEL